MKQTLASWVCWWHCSGMHAQGHVLARVSPCVSSGHHHQGFRVLGIGFRDDGPCHESNPSIMGLLVALLGNACTRACPCLGFTWCVLKASSPRFRV